MKSWFIFTNINEWCIDMIRLEKLRDILT